jgi:hypothetical protein
MGADSWKVSNTKGLFFPEFLVGRGEDFDLK